MCSCLALFIFWCEKIGASCVIDTWILLSSFEQKWDESIVSLSSDQRNSKIPYYDKSTYYRLTEPSKCFIKTPHQIVGYNFFSRRSIEKVLFVAKYMTVWTEFRSFRFVSSNYHRACQLGKSPIHRWFITVQRYYL